jgi:uncharacterized membrane protein YdjX (TVP38/TMEM64 family)
MASSVKFRDLCALSGLVALIVVGGALALSYDRLWTAGSDLTGWIDGMGVWGAVAVIALMVLHSFVPFPSEFIALGAGAVYGTLIGSALIWTGAMFGASLSFWLARLLGRTATERLLPARYQSVLDNWTEDQGAMSLLVSRFIPIIAFNLINYAAGLTRIGWWTFLWTTSIGILPLTVLMAYLGARMTELSWPYLLASSVVGIVTIWALHRFIGKRGWFPRRSRFAAGAQTCRSPKPRGNRAA